MGSNATQEGDTRICPEAKVSTTKEKHTPSTGNITVILGIIGHFTSGGATPAAKETLIKNCGNKLFCTEILKCTYVRSLPSA